MRTKLLNNLIWAGKTWFASPSDKTDDSDGVDSGRDGLSNHGDEVEDDGRGMSSGRSSTSYSVGSSEESQDEEADDIKQCDEGSPRMPGHHQETARKSTSLASTIAPTHELSSRTPTKATQSLSTVNSETIEFERYAERIREVRKTDYPALRGEYQNDLCGLLHFLHLLAAAEMYADSAFPRICCSP